MDGAALRVLSDDDMRRVISPSRAHIRAGARSDGICEGGATPSSLLDAMVIDIETTGLDPRTARVVELAAVWLAGGRLDDYKRCAAWSNPVSRSRPPRRASMASMTRRSADAPAFAAVWPEFSRLEGAA